MRTSAANLLLHSEWRPGGAALQFGRQRRAAIGELTVVASVGASQFMSLELHIFIQNSQVPSRDAWQQAIEEAGFPTVLEPTLDLRRDTGFRPTTYKDQATGYEFYLEPAAGFIEAYPHIAEHIGSRDVCATFRWGGDLTECAAAISSAAALTKLADGVYFYPDDDIVRTAADAVEATREELASI